MSKVFGAVIVVLGIWVGVEFMTEGPSRAFGGAFASFFSASEAPQDRRSTARRAGDSVSRAQAEAEARRERMLGD